MQRTDSASNGIGLHVHLHLGQTADGYLIASGSDRAGAKGGRAMYNVLGFTWNTFD